MEIGAWLLYGLFMAAVGYLMGRFKRIGKFWEIPGEDYDRER